MRGRLVCILFLILFCNVFFLAAKTVTVTTTYVQEPSLNFQYGLPPNLKQYQDDSAITNSHFIAHLGTLTIWTDGNNLKDPNLYAISMDTNLFITGYVYSNGQYVLADTPVEVWAITVIGGSVESVVQLQSGATNLAPNAGNFLPGENTMTSYIILINTNKGLGYFIPGMVYTTTSGLGLFQVSVDPQGGTNPEAIVPIIVNGEETTTAPIVGVPSDTIPEIPFQGDDGDDGYPFTHEFQFTILNNVESFDLYNAIEGRKATIAAAQLQVSLGDPTKQYGVQIAFTSTTPASDFEMHLNGDPSQYALPYYLYLNGEYMQKNVFTLWDGIYVLSNGSVTLERPITVAVKEGTELSGAPEGSYSDTVTVVIIPLDTL